MPRSRDRHARGFRGALALPNPITGRPVPVRTRPTRGERFLQAIEDAIARVQRSCPDCLTSIDVGVDEVPTRPAMWQGLTDHGAVPLAAAIDAEPGQPARVIIYRRPLEHRAIDDDDLLDIVHRTLVEQLSILTGRSTADIDPEGEDW